MDSAAILEKGVWCHLVMKKTLKPSTRMNPQKDPGKVNKMIGGTDPPPFFFPLSIRSLTMKLPMLQERAIILGLQLDCMDSLGRLAIIKCSSFWGYNKEPLYLKSTNLQRPREA